MQIALVLAVAGIAGLVIMKCSKDHRNTPAPARRPQSFREDLGNWWPATGDG
jgi:hypothetical protein